MTGVAFTGPSVNVDANARSARDAWRDGDAFTVGSVNIAPFQAHRYAAVADRASDTRLPRSAAGEQNFARRWDAEAEPVPEPRRVALVERVVLGEVVGRPRQFLQRIDAEELSGRRIVGASAHVDEARVRAGVFPIEPERRRSAAFARRRAIGRVAAFPGDGPRRSRQQPRAARLIVMKVCHRSGCVVDLLDWQLVGSVDVAVCAVVED